MTSSGNSITVTLTGANKFYYVLGVYTATSDGITSNATWSNDGMETYGGFDAPAWEALQLKQMILLFRDKDEVNDIYEKANLVAKTYDPIYSEPTEYTELINEHEFELTAHHLTDAEINAMCKLSNEEMNIMAIDAINEIYGYDTSVLQFVDTEPNFRYVLEDDKLIYRAWLYVSNGIDNGQFLVMIDAETGMIEDMVYDSKLESIG